MVIKLEVVTLMLVMLVIKFKVVNLMLAHFFTWRGLQTTLFSTLQSMVLAITLVVVSW